VVSWALRPAIAAPALAAATARLPRYRRPTAVRWRARPLVARAEPAALERHGRLADARWAELWQARLRRTTARAQALLAADAAPAIATPAAGTPSDVGGVAPCEARGAQRGRAATKEKRRGPLGGSAAQS